MTAAEIDTRKKLDELFSLHRQLRSAINRFWEAKREFDQLKDDFQHIRNNGHKRIDLADLNYVYFG